MREDFGLCPIVLINLGACQMDRDEQKKLDWLNCIISQQIVPANPDVDLSEIIKFLNNNSKYMSHCIRFIGSYMEIVRRAKPQKGWRIAETGSLSGVSAFLQSIGYSVDALKGDFRYMIDAQSDSYDLLISLEVLEHIKDQEPKEFDDLVNFNFSGITCFLSEMRRVVRPGGLLALSTPNACSLINLTRLLNYEPPMMFWPHVKEYSPADVVRRAEEAGFKLRYWVSLYGLFHLDINVRERELRQTFETIGASPDNRGDVAFFLFEKPSSLTENVTVAF